MDSEHEPGTVEWIAAQLATAGGSVALEALECALEPADGAAREALRLRLRHSPRFLTRPDGQVAFVRDFLRGTYFRYAPSLGELSRGALRLDGTELHLALAQTAGHPDLEVAWRAADDEVPHRTRLARDANDGWLLPGLGEWMARVGFAPGDDMIVHLRDLEAPLLVLAHQARIERDDGAIARRDQALVEAAIALMVEQGGWMALDRLLKQLLARFDFRQPFPPDSFGRTLVLRDNRFTCSADGRELRLSFFHHDDTARAYLATVGSPLEAMSAFFEEFPPESQADRAKALAYLEALWQSTPRIELAGQTPEQAREQAHKLVPFKPRGGVIGGGA